MEKEIISSINILNLNTKLFTNCFNDVNDSMASKCINDAINPMNFIALHLLDARYYLAKFAGVHIESPYSQITKGAEKPCDIKNYPPVNEMILNWTDIGNLLADTISNLKSDFLSSSYRTKFPVENKTKLGVITFLVQHESYHIGQLGLIRKLHGLPAMSY
ncbi:MAG: DinB family protein [Bacteroidetes bacterium]|nr:DinB family protein [Bacteroidota bacterium]